jgi:hypothetical protein
LSGRRNRTAAHRLNPGLVALPAVGQAADAPPPAAAGERTPSWLGVRVVGEVGFGQATLAAAPAIADPGGRHAALAIGLGFEGEGWVRPQLGLGLRLTSGFYAPLAITRLENSYALLEPQLLGRTAPRLFGPRKLFAVSWRASVGVGVSSVNTDAPCGKHCDVVYARADRLSASASAGGLLSVGPVGLYLGLRFAFDTSVDWATSLNLGLGVEL